MAAHWVSAKYTGVDGEGRPGILYEAADLVEGMEYVGIVDDCNYLTGLKGTAIGAVSGSVGSVMLPAEYAGKTITLNLCGGAIVPNVLLDSISVAIPLVEPTPPTAVKLAPPYVPKVGEVGIEAGSIPYNATVLADGVNIGRYTTAIWYPDTTKQVTFRYPGYEECIKAVTAEPIKTTIFDEAGNNALVRRVFCELKKLPEECSQDLIIRFTDDPDRVADVFFTAVGGLPNIPIKSATKFTIPCKSNTDVTINVGVTPYTIASFKSFRACTGEVEEIPLQAVAPPPEDESVQTFSIADAEGNPVEGATVTVGGKSCVTDSLGECSITAPIGEATTATITKSGYADTEIPLTPTADGDKHFVVLTEEVIITQLIFVKKAGEGQAEYITGATVTVNGLACEALPDGLYSIDIAEGIEATAEVKAEGYKDKTETFTTTGIASLLISLEPIIPEGESVQIFTLKDAAGNPIEGATITVGDESCVTDSSGKCTITAPIGEEATATITKPGYVVEEIQITPEEGGNEYGVELKKAGELFSVPGNLKDDFDSETVTAGIKTAFSASGIPLSDDATIEKIDDNTWLVKDGEDEYAVVKENGDLKVYPGGGGGGGAPPTPPEPEPPTPPEPGEPQWDYVEFDTWVDNSNKARIKYKGIDLTSETEYHGVFEIMFPPEVHVGTLINTASLSGYVDIDATMNEGKTVEIRLYEYASGKPSKIIDRKDVTIPMRPEIDQVEVILGPEMLALWQATPTRVVYCDELIDYAWPFLAWFPPMFGLEVRKNVTDGKAIFTAADGLVKGKEYIFHMYPQLALEELIKQNAVKFGYTPSVTLTKTNIMEEVMCPFFGFEPGSVECENEVNEFIDAYYVANTIKKLTTGKNLLGEADTADMFDIIFMPIIMLGAAVPFIPVGKTLKVALGPIVDLIRKGDKGAWLAKNQHKMHLALAAGKGASIEEAKALMAAGKWAEAETLLDNVVREIHNSPALSATARENLAGWNAGARKLLDDNPQMTTKIDDLTDEAVDGTIFKTHFDEIIRHFDEAAAAGDWVKAKQIWIDGVAGSVDNLLYFERNLIKASPDFQMVHNILRYTTPEYITALKGANRYDVGVRYLVNHIGETGKEIEKYQLFIKHLDDTELNAIVKNLRAAGGEGKTVAAILDDSFKTFIKAEAKGIPIPSNAKAASVSDTAFRATEDTDIQNQMLKAFVKEFEAAGDTDMVRMILEMGNSMPPTESAVKAVIDACKEVRIARTAAGIAPKMTKLRRIMKHWKLLLGASIGVASTLFTAGGFGMFLCEEGFQQANFATFAMINNNLWSEAEAYIGLPDKPEVHSTMELIYNDAKGTADAYSRLNPLLAPAYTLFWQGALNKIEADQRIIGARNIRYPAGQDYKAPTRNTLFLEVWHDGTKFRGAGMVHKEFQQHTTDPAKVVSAINEADFVVGWKLDGQLPFLKPHGLDLETIRHKIVDLAYDTNGLDSDGTNFYMWAHGNPAVDYFSGKIGDLPENKAWFIPYNSIQLAGEVDGHVGFASILPDKTITEKKVLDFLAYRANAIKTMYVLGVENKVIEVLGKGNGSLYVFCTPKANIRLTGGVWDNHLVGLTGTLHDDIPPGTYTLVLDAEGYIPLTVTPDIQIFPNQQTTVEMQTLKPSEGAIRCERVHNDEYLDRKADIFYKKHSDTDWIKWHESAPTTIGGYEDIEGLEVGVAYDVKYNFLEVLECINGTVLTIPSEGVVDCNECQLNSCLPEKVITTVREVIDGDSFRTDYTNGLPKRSYGGELLPQEIRIIGCNCYEVGSPIGQVAKEKLAELIEGKSVTLLIDKNLPLGYHNRVIAGVFYPDDSNHAANDVAGKLIEACVVREYPTKSEQDTYSWEPYSYLNSKWADHTPEMCVRSTDDVGKPLISMTTDPATKTVQMHNRGLPVYAVVRMFKVGMPFYSVTDYAQRALYASSASYGYQDATSLKLYASTEPIDDKNTGFEIETIIIGEAPPDTYTVTFTSNPPGASVSTIPGTITISRLTSVLRSQRDSTPISRLFRKERFK